MTKADTIVSAFVIVVALRFDTSAALVYSDHYSVENGNRVRHPLIDYQEGSVRDNFASAHRYLSTPRC